MAEPQFDPSQPYEEVPDAGTVFRSVFPTAHINQELRPSDSLLARKNPSSTHIPDPSSGRTGFDTIDVRPSSIPGETFDSVKQKIEAAGHKVVYAKDEVTNPSKHATGPHWHYQIEAGAPVFDPSKPFEVVDDKTVPTPAPTPEGDLLPDWMKQREADSNDPLTHQLQQNPSEQQPDVNWMSLGPKGEGDGLLGRVGNALATPGLPDQYAAFDPMGMMHGISGAASVINAGMEALKGTPLEGLAMAFPDGPHGVGGSGVARLAPEVEAGWVNALDKGSKEDILSYAQEHGFNTDPDKLDAWLLSGRGRKAEAVYQDPPLPPQAEHAVRAPESNLGYTETPTLEPVLKTAPAAPVEHPVAPDKYSAEEVQQHVSDTMGDWKNPPKVNILQDAEQLDPDMLNDLKDQGLENDVLGFHNEDGVTLIANNIDKDMLPSVTFHESLGHHGLAQMFGNHLDTVLHQMYDSNSKLQGEVHDWNNDPTNHGAYDSYDDPLARQIEEVLAEKANDGALSAPLRNKVVTIMKQYARKMGFTGLKYSNREIATTLAMSHDRVINGSKFSNSGLIMKPRFMVKKGGDKSPYDVYEEAAKKFKPLSTDEISTEVEKARSTAYDQATEGKDIEPSGYTRALKHQQEGTGRFLSPDTVMEGVNAADKAEKDWRQQYKEDHDNWRYYESLKTGQDNAPSFMMKKSRGRELLEAKKAARAAAAEAERVRQERLEAKRNRPAGNLNLNNVKATDRTKDFMKDIAMDAEPRESQSHLQTQEFARAGRMVPEDVHALPDVLKPEQLLAAREAEVRSATRGGNLQKRIDDGDTTPETMAKYVEAAEAHGRLFDKMSEIRGDFGRGLNSFKIEAGHNPSAEINLMAKALETRGITAEALRNGEVSAKDVLDTMEDVRKALTSQKRIEAIKNIVPNIGNLSKAIRASIDLSAPLRQGLFLIGEKGFWTSLEPMVKAFMSNRNYMKTFNEIIDRPSYPRMQKSGLSLTDIHGSLDQREENYMTNLAKHIPLVERSERAYVTFLNKLRADTFDSIIRDFEKAGIKEPRRPSQNEGESKVNFKKREATWRSDERVYSEKAKAVANYINNATGRGNLGSFDHAAATLNTVVFSPRLMTSRLQMLVPTYFVKAPKPLKIRAVRNYLALSAVLGTVYGLAWMNGVDVKSDWKDKKFGQLHIHNTWYDITGGTASYIHMLGTLLTQKYVDSKGNVKDYGTKFKDKNWVDDLGHFARGKESPLAGYAHTAVSGKDFIGKPYDKINDTVNMFVPMWLDTVNDIATTEGKDYVWMALPDFFGVNTQSYSPDSRPWDRQPSRTLHLPMNEQVDMEGHISQQAPTPPHKTRGHKSAPTFDPSQPFEVVK